MATTKSSPSLLNKTERRPRFAVYLHLNLRGLLGCQSVQRNHPASTDPKGVTGRRYGP